MRLLFEYRDPRHSASIFKKYDWFDFYRGAGEAIPLNKPEERGLGVDASVFIDADLAEEKLIDAARLEY